MVCTDRNSGPGLVHGRNWLISALKQLRQLGAHQTHLQPLDKCLALPLEVLTQQVCMVPGGYTVQADFKNLCSEDLLNLSFYVNPHPFPLSSLYYFAPALC